MKRPKKDRLKKKILGSNDSKSERFERSLQENTFELGISGEDEVDQFEGEKTIAKDRKIVSKDNRFEFVKFVEYYTQKAYLNSCCLII